jgi:formate dehydrogenase iron-sulfur subunit
VASHSSTALPRRNPGSAASKSFYSLTKVALESKACQGLACYVARHLDQGTWDKACAQPGKLYCLGKCYAGPATDATSSRPIIEVHSRQPVVLERIVNGGARSLKSYTAGGGYQALAQCRQQSPEKTIQAVEQSGLRGRGGAGFPAGRKWREVFSQPGKQKYVVANADEGDPGAYIDRFIIEDDPHRLIEAMAIAGHAVGASHGFIYLRKEYPVAEQVLRAALDEARGAGLIGKKAGFELEITMGHGSYVCGEETALLNSIEGRRAEVRQRPPYPTEQGLWGKPTLVNNVETLVCVPWILEHGADAYRALGFSKSQGTKLVSLNSLFNRPGLYEVEFGVTVRHIVETLGGGLKSGTLRGVIIGGPLAGILPASLLDTPFGFDELRAVGAMVGHGGIVAFDEKTSIADIVRHVAEFAAAESCGKCTPCRRGSPRLAELPARDETDDLVAALLNTSLCGLGTGLGEFTASALKHYAKELAPCLK